MAMYFIQVFLVVVLLQRMLWITSASMDCPCYTFHTDMKTRVKSKEDCTTNNGSLVVMETVEEWKFINSQIQNITVSGGDGNNEWFIGLKGKKTGDWERLSGDKRTRSRRNGWTWINGKKLTIDKWQDRQPNGDLNINYCVKMAKNYPKGSHGLFDDLSCTVTKPYICEYSKGGSSDKDLVCNNECKSLQTTAPPAVVTTTPITTQSIVAITTDMQATDPTTSTSTSVKPEVLTSVSTSSKPAMTESTTNKQNQVSDVVIALIALAVVLALFICIFIFVFWWMKKKAGKSMSFNKSKPTPESSTPDEIPLNIKNDLNPPPLCVEIVGHDTVIYAEVNNELKPPPVPVFVDVSDYAEPVDSINTNNLYASVDDNQTQEKAKNENTSQINADNINDSKNNDQPESENTYAVVDKSKKTKKQDDLYASVDDNHAQERGRFHMNGGVDTVKIESSADIMDAVNVNHMDEEPENMAVYAVVDKSKKTKKQENDLEAMYAQVDKSKKTN